MVLLMPLTFQRFQQNAHPNVWGKRPEALFGALLIEAGPDTQKTHTEKGQGFFYTVFGVFFCGREEQSLHKTWNTW